MSKVVMKVETVVLLLVEVVVAVCSAVTIVEVDMAIEVGMAQFMIVVASTVKIEGEVLKGFQPFQHP